ncbi:glycosyltransferase family A protein [uncultured Winogradskyella sp.]|uniref:glycosyltransferase family 2 protein n=1 Tax=uncultured Winogradskyella sp. TaxID=395353 RepID=UPI002601690F|nr:glycosyltransferase family A protein [uncultured Winogradskyella sp.]
MQAKQSFVFPVYNDLPESVKIVLTKDENYKDKDATLYDLSWQALQLGFIGEVKTFSTFKTLSKVDNYRFIRKYFNQVWAVYILLLRVVTLKNPFTEINAFLKSRSVKRSKYLKTPILYPKWKTFDSKLLREKSLVSVVIPTLNRYKYLKDVLSDLEKQDYLNFEVIIIDQSDPFNNDFYKDFELDLIVHHQKERALWLARNEAIKMSKGEFLLLFDDDSRVEPNWISNHVKCLDFFNADISSGVSISLVGAKVPENYTFFRRSDQLDTGNVLIKKQVFRNIGLFDRQFEKQRMGDGEYGLRAHVNGFLNVSNPFAQRLHLKVGSGGLREMGSWDGFRPKKWFGPRPIPSVLYYFRRYYGTKRTLLSLLKTVPPSVIPYSFKGNKMALFFGFIIAFVLSPIVIFQVCRSWYLASKKIDYGALIAEL